MAANVASPIESSETASADPLQLVSQIPHALRTVILGEINELSQAILNIDIEGGGDEEGNVSSPPAKKRKQD